MAGSHNLVVVDCVHFIHRDANEGILSACAYIGRRMRRQMWLLVVVCIVSVVCGFSSVWYAQSISNRAGEPAAGSDSAIGQIPLDAQPVAPPVEEKRAEILTDSGQGH
jgi:hypothetical protein